MGYMTGTIQRMPGRGKKGEIVADDGTLFTFALFADQKERLTVGGRVRFLHGSKNTARDLKVSYSSHSLVGRP